MDSQPYTISDPGNYPQPPSLQEQPPHSHPPNILLIVGPTDPTGEPKHFRLKKYILMTFLTVNILWYVVAMFQVNAAVAMLMVFVKLGNDDQEERNNEEEMKGIQTLLVLVIIFFLALTGLIMAVFLFGIVHQNLCLSTVFVVVAALESFSMVAKMLASSGAGLLSALFSIIIAVLAYLFLKDLRMMKDCQLQQNFASEDGGGRH